MSVIFLSELLFPLTLISTSSNKFGTWHAFTVQEWSLRSSVKTIETAKHTCSFSLDVQSLIYRCFAREHQHLVSSRHTCSLVIEQFESTPFVLHSNWKCQTIRLLSYSQRCPRAFLTIILSLHLILHQLWRSFVGGERLFVKGYRQHSFCSNCQNVRFHIFDMSMSHGTDLDMG